MFLFSSLKKISESKRYRTGELMLIIENINNKIIIPLIIKIKNTKYIK